MTSPNPNRDENVKETLRLLTLIRDAPRETREVKSRLEASTAKVEKGRLWIWVDAKLVEWLDKQVENGKYRSRSHAVEKMIQSKMREETTRAYEI